MDHLARGILSMWCFYSTGSEDFLLSTGDLIPGVILHIWICDFTRGIGKFVPKIVLEAVGFKPIGLTQYVVTTFFVLAVFPLYTARMVYTLCF